MPTLTHAVLGTLVFRAGHVRMMDGGEFIRRVIAVGPDLRRYELVDDREKNPAEYIAQVPAGEYAIVARLYAIGIGGPIETTRVLVARAVVRPAERTIVDRASMMLDRAASEAEEREAFAEFRRTMMRRPGVTGIGTGRTARGRTVIVYRNDHRSRWDGPMRWHGMPVETRDGVIRAFSPAGDAALSANARMILALRAPPIDRAPSGLPVTTPYPQWCPECVRVDPTVQPVDRLRMLNAYCDEAVRDPEIRSFAATIYADTVQELGRQPTACEMLTRLMVATHDLVDYLPDPEGEEIFQNVRSVLFNGLGRHVSRLTGRLRGGDDCEGLATVFVTLARILGFRASNVWWEQPGAALNHVAAQVCDGGAWPTEFGSPRCIPIETTIPGALPNETPYEAIARIGPAYRERVFGAA